VSVFAALTALWLPALRAHADPPVAYDVRAAFLEADTNKDGVIEIGEFYDRLVDVFFLDDKDKDGFLSHDEFVAAVVIDEPFAEVDRNGDGKISKQEFVRARLPLFRAADTNDDGTLSLEEVIAIYEVKGKK
jgi:Ca2+-binding EF-hand superfamily protein